MHCKDWNTGIDRIDVTVCQIQRNGSTAALFILTHLGHLPDNAGIIHQFTELANHLCRSIGCAALSAVSGIFAECHTMIDLGIIACFKYFCIVRIIGCCYVSANTEGICEAVTDVHFLSFAQVTDEPFECFTDHTGHADRPDLFFICKDADAGLLQILCIKQACHFCICTDSVIMSVSRDQTAVQSDVSCFACRNHFQLSRDQILFDQSVFLIQKFEDAQFHAVGIFLVTDRTGADQNIQDFRWYCLIQDLLIGWLAQMRKQILDDELRIILVTADIDCHALAVLQDDYPMKLQRSCQPLVFPDAAIVMRLQICQLRIFIQRVWLQIQTRCIRVRCCQINALLQALGTDHSQHDGFATVIEIHFISGFQLHSCFIFFKAFALCQFDAVVHAQALRLSMIQEILIRLAVRIHFLFFRRGQIVIAVSRFIEKFFF